MGTEMELEAYDNDEKVWLSKSTCFKAYNTKNGKLYLINLYTKKKKKKKRKKERDKTSNF